MTARRIDTVEDWMRDIDKRLALQERRRRGAAAAVMATASSPAPLRGLATVVVFSGEDAVVPLPPEAAGATVVIAAFSDDIGVVVNAAIRDGEVHMYAAVTDGSYGVNLIFADSL